MEAPRDGVTNTVDNLSFPGLSGSTAVAGSTQSDNYGPTRHTTLGDSHSRTAVRVFDPQHRSGSSSTELRRSEVTHALQTDHCGPAGAPSDHLRSRLQATPRVDPSPRTSTETEHLPHISSSFADRSPPGVSSIFSSEPSDLAQQSPVDPTVAQVRAAVIEVAPDRTPTEADSFVTGLLLGRRPRSDAPRRRCRAR